MLNKINFDEKRLSWIGGSPSSEKKVALLIPQFNEASHENFESRLEYFYLLSKKYGDILDVILIDDGSTDDSLMRMAQYKEEHGVGFFLASVTPNANKVGALYLTVMSVNYHYIVLSDFDTDLSGVDHIARSIESLESDISFMGCYFRMLPHEGVGQIFLFQQLEYSLHRSFYRFHKKDQSVPVMPGAGACFKRPALLRIYGVHSGLRNGEDREATMLGLKMGYKVFYEEEILSLTRPPLSFRALVKQRVRWNLGYIETMYKERFYYKQEIIKFSSIGIRTLLDFATVAFNILFPVVLLMILFFSVKYAVVMLTLVYILGLILPINSVAVAPGESNEFRRQLAYSILWYPIIKTPLDCIAWTRAFVKFVKQYPSAKRLLSQKNID